MRLDLLHGLPRVARGAVSLHISSVCGPARGRRYQLYSDQLELHVVELPKVPVLGSAAKEAENPERQLVAWGTFLMARSEEALQELAKMSPVFEKAKKALEALSGKAEVQEIARQRELALLTYKLELGEARREGEREGERAGRAAGGAEGRAQALLAILAARRLELSAEVRSRMASCTDIGTLDRWIARAATAQSAAEVIS